MKTLIVEGTKLIRRSFRSEFRGVGGFEGADYVEGTRVFLALLFNVG